MCGIAGSIGSADESRTTSVAGRLKHRGPDSHSLWADPSIALAQTRLAIVDTSEHGTQPFFSPDGRYAVIYNGELYNHAALRQRYKISADPCDGAILPSLWAKLGAKCLEEIEGMYAMCVHDRDSGHSWLAVDPLGVKPLYVSTLASGTYFASEAVALATQLSPAPGVDSGARALFEAWGCLPSDMSGLRGVTRLSPGEVRRYDTRGVEIGRSWISLTKWRRGETSWADVVDAFVASVEAHLMSDVPIGLMLSEGVDSAAIAWAAAEVGQRLECFTLDFKGSPGEGEGAARIARSYGHNHTTITSDPDLPSVVRGFLAAVDRPTCDGLNTYLICSEMRQIGLKAALTGTGGDEVLLGYGHHLGGPATPPWFATPAASSARRLISLRSNGLPPAGWNQRLSPRTADQLVRRLHGLARNGLATQPAQRVRAFRAQHPYYRELPHPFPGPRFEDLASDSPMLAITDAEWRHYLGPTLLADADVFSMANSLELRVPFVDLGVVAAALPVKDRHPGKQAFVNATKDNLLAEIVRRPKTGFTLPMARWISAIEGLELGMSLADTPALPRVLVPDHRQVLDRWKSIVWAAWLRRVEAPRS